MAGLERSEIFKCNLTCNFHFTFFGALSMRIEDEICFRGRISVTYDRLCRADELSLDMDQALLGQF